MNRGGGCYHLEFSLPCCLQPHVSDRFRRIYDSVNNMTFLFMLGEELSVLHASVP